MKTGSIPGNAAAQGIMFSIAGVFLMGVGDGFSKLIGEAYGPIQIFTVRAGFNLVPVLALVWLAGGVAAIRTAKPRLHAWRALLSAGSSIPFVYSLQLMPLAEATAITFAGPILVAAFSMPMLGERVGPRRWLAILAGFAGVLLIIRPGTSAFQPAALLPLATALCNALSMILARRVSRDDGPACIVFWQVVGSLAIGLLILPFDWHPPSAADWGLFAVMGLVGAASMVLMIHSYRAAAAAIVAPFYYTIILWSLAFGLLIWNELPDPAIWPGVALLVASGLFIIYRETKLAARRP